MWFLLGVFTAVAVWWLFPFALFAARRLLLSLRLRRWARRHGAVFQPLKPFWFFDSIRRGRCACMIETADTRYVLKLGGGVSKRLLYHFIDPTHYAVRSLRFEWLASNVRFDAYKRKAKEPLPLCRSQRSVRQKRMPSDPSVVSCFSLCLPPNRGARQNRDALLVPTVRYDGCASRRRHSAKRRFHRRSLFLRVERLQNASLNL